MPFDYLSKTKLIQLSKQLEGLSGKAEEMANVVKKVKKESKPSSGKSKQQKAWEKKIEKQMEQKTVKAKPSELKEQPVSIPEKPLGGGLQKHMPSKETVAKTVEVKPEKLKEQPVVKKEISKPTKAMIPQKALKTKLGQLEQKTEKGATPEELKKKVVVETPVTKEQAIGIVKQKQEDVKSKIEQQTKEYKQALQLSYITEIRNLAQLQHAESYLSRQLSKIRKAPQDIQFEVNGKIMSKQEAVDFLESQHQNLLKEVERVKKEYEKYRQSLKRQTFENVYSLKKAEQSYSKYMSQIESLPDVYKFVRKGEEIEVISPTEKYKRDIEKIRKTWGPVGGAVFTAGLTIGKGLVAPTEWVVKTFKLPGWKKMVEKPSRLGYIPLGIEVPFSSEMREYYARHPELVVGGALGETFGFWLGGKGLGAVGKGISKGAKAVSTAYKSAKVAGKFRFLSKLPVSKITRPIQEFKTRQLFLKTLKPGHEFTFVERLGFKHPKLARFLAGKPLKPSTLEGYTFAERLSLKHPTVGRIVRYVPQKVHEFKLRQPLKPSEASRVYPPYEPVSYEEVQTTITELFPETGKLSKPKMFLKDISDYYKVRPGLRYRPPEGWREYLATQRESMALSRWKGTEPLLIVKKPTTKPFTIPESYLAGEAYKPSIPTTVSRTGLKSILKTEIKPPVRERIPPQWRGIYDVPSTELVRVKTPTTLVSPISRLTTYRLAQVGLVTTGLASFTALRLGSLKLNIPKFEILKIPKIKPYTPEQIVKPLHKQVTKPKRITKVEREEIPIQIPEQEERKTPVRIPTRTTKPALRFKLPVGSKEKETLVRIPIVKQPPIPKPPKIRVPPLPSEEKKKKRKPLIHVYKPSKTMYAWRRFKLPEFFFRTKSKR